MAFSTHHRYPPLIAGALTIALAGGCQSISGWLNPWSTAQVEKKAASDQESYSALASAPLADEALPGTSINDVPGTGSYRERSSASSCDVPKTAGCST